MAMMNSTETETILTNTTDPDVESASEIEPIEDLQVQWQKLTHSTLLIGWGYDETIQEKYWLVRNSYGKKWGESGNFMVRRGANDFGAEGEMGAFIPQLLI